MTIGDRIKERRQQLGMTLEDVAIKANTGRATIHKYETGLITNIPSDKIERIADALGTTPAYLMGWEGNLNTETETRATAISDNIVAELSERLTEALQDTTTTDLANKIGMSKQAISSYAAGVRSPKRPIISAISEALNINPLWLMGYDVPRCKENIDSSYESEVFALKIKGHSMEPRLYEGDIVIVKKQNDVESGEIAVVEVDGNTTTKKIVKQDNGIMVIGLNSAAYTPKFYSYDQVKIVGKVIEVRGTMDGWNK